MKGKERTLIEFAARFLGSDPDRMYLAYLYYDRLQLTECGVDFRRVHGREELRNYLFLYGFEYIKLSKNSLIRKVNKLHFKLRKILWMIT